MRLTRSVIAITLALGFAATAATAAEKPTAPPPAAMQKLLECRSITDTTQRLACLDAGVAALADAVEKRDVVVATREQVKQARRSLFGIALPTLNLFGGGKDGDDDKADSDALGALKEIEATLKGARQGPGRNWRFVLDDDSVWVQTDSRMMPRDPRAGMKIRIRRAAVGSFLANVDGQTAVRVRRLNE
jgi:glucose/arabinose dehydrogenase